MTRQETQRLNGDPSPCRQLYTPKSTQLDSTPQTVRVPYLVLSLRFLMNDNRTNHLEASGISRRN